VAGGIGNDVPRRVLGDLRWATRSDRFAGLTARDENLAQILRVMAGPLRTLPASDGSGSNDILPGWTLPGEQPRRRPGFEAPNRWIGRAQHIRWQAKRPEKANRFAV